MINKNINPLGRTMGIDRDGDYKHTRNPIPTPMSIRLVSPYVLAGQG